MPHTYSLDETLIYLLSAVIVVTLFRRLKISPIIGYLIAGVLIGPHAFQFATDIEFSKFLGEIGVVFLLFSIGLKLPFQRLQSLQEYVFGIGCLQVVISTGVLAGAVYYFTKLSLDASILIGSGLALSSTAVCLQILSDSEELAAKFGRITFATLLFQDLAVVLFLVLLTSLIEDHGSVMGTLGYAALKAGIVLAIIVSAGRVILKPVYRILAGLGNPELFVGATLLVVLTTSMATAQAGLSMELGAFLAGLLMSETEYRHQVQADIQPFYGLLLGLFFMTVGMSIDLSLVADNILLILSIIISLVLTKFLIFLAIGQVLKIGLLNSIRSGLLLSTGGEFLFVLLAPAVAAGVVPNEIGQLLFVAVAISLGTTPFLDMIGKSLSERYSGQELKVGNKNKPTTSEDLKNHIVIVGFGRLGTLVARLMTERVIPFVALDKSMKQVQEGQSRGQPVYYGDGRRVQVMRSVGVDKAKICAVCVHSPAVAVRIAIMIRKNFPDVYVVVRLPDDEYQSKLLSIGAHVVMPENLEPSLQVGGTILKALHLPETEVQQIVDNFRKSLNHKTKKESVAPGTPEK